MRFSLLIGIAPQDPQAHFALQFVQSLLTSGHQIYRLFFHNEGLHCCLENMSDADAWRMLIHNWSLDAVVCSASAAGLEIEKRHLIPAVEIAGLLELADMHDASDRLVSF